MTKGRSTAAAARKGVRPAHRWGVYLVAAMLLLLGVTVAVSQLLWAEAAPEPAAASAAPPPTNSAQVSPAPAGADGAQTLNLYGGGMRPLVEERDGVQTLNIYGPGGRIIAQVVQDGQGAETVRYLLTDHLGSTRVVLDAEGNAVARYEYAPHGETTVAGASGAEVQYRYTGHPYDEGQEVYETPNRGYEPTLGRFLSVDPRRQDASPYVYTGNNPVGYLDTTGGGDVPFFMVSNLDLDGAGATRSIAELFGIQPGQKIIDATDFNTIGKRQSFDMQSKAVLDPLDILYPEKEVTYSYNDKLFWLIGDEHGAAMPNQLEPGLRELRTLEPGLAREIVLLDFSTTNRGEMIQAGLNEMKESSTLVKAEYLKSGSDVTGFILNGRDLSPRDFIEHVEGQLSRPIPSQMLPYPYAETSGTTTQSNGATGTATQPTAGTAGQKRSLEFGVVSDPKRPETSIGADSLSGEVERSGVLGDLSLPFPEVPEYIPPLPESFSIEPR